MIWARVTCVNTGTLSQQGVANSGAKPPIFHNQELQFLTEWYEKHSLILTLH